MDDPRLGPPGPDGARLLPRILHPTRPVRGGRRWDHLRSDEPVIVPSYVVSAAGPSPPDPELSWANFIQSSAWGRPRGEDSEIVSYDEMRKLFGTLEGGEPRMSFQTASSRVSRRRCTPGSFVYNALAPLFFRLGVVITSILALAIAARIYQLENESRRDTAERTQSIVAITVDCVAIPYIGYMIYDELTGKPIGLRSGTSKISLILLDLFFIMFKSASTALAFESLVYSNVREAVILRLAAALGVFELVGLISWAITFSINVYRTVWRMGGAHVCTPPRRDSWHSV